MLEKKRLVDQGGVFAHPILCISSGLSTAGLPSGRLLLAKQSEAVFSLPGTAHSAQRCNGGSWPWRMRFQPCRDRDRVWHLLSSRFDSADKTRSNRTGKISAGSNKRVLSSRFFRSR